MKFLTMWHHQLGWGASTPQLQPDKLTVVKATGLTLAKIRELGWKWIVVDVPVPDEALNKEGELARVDEMISELQEQRLELMKVEGEA